MREALQLTRLVVDRHEVMPVLQLPNEGGSALEKQDERAIEHHDADRGAVLLNKGVVSETHGHFHTTALFALVKDFMKNESVWRGCAQGVIHSSMHCLVRCSSITSSKYFLTLHPALPTASCCPQTSQ